MNNKLCFTITKIDDNIIAIIHSFDRSLLETISEWSKSCEFVYKTFSIQDIDHRFNIYNGSFDYLLELPLIVKDEYKEEFTIIFKLMFGGLFSSDEDENEKCSKNLETE